MKKLILLLTVAIISISRVSAQADTPITGVIKDAAGEPIIGAEIIWKGTGTGALTFVDGTFLLDRVDGRDTLLITYLGYESDTIDIRQAVLPLDITMLETTQQLNEVELTAQGPSTFNNRFTAIQTTKITGQELCRAACCNLSESFETNASVDVAYSDAATGAKQIKMLGLSGIYVQLLTENSPGVRGLAQNFGMEYIPGSWMESIQVSKGTASVINGYEATTGQINVEYLKPRTADPVSVNGMFNSMLGGEVNVEGAVDVTDKWSTGILAHYKGVHMEHDENGDGFKDMPTMNEVNVMNRWYYKGDNYTAQYMVRGLYDHRLGGTMSALRDITAGWNNPDGTWHGATRGYEIDMKAWRVEGLIKQGIIFDKEKGTSIGLILAGSYHSLDNQYGLYRLYRGGQGNLNFNGIFQTNFNDSHKLSAGISVNYDDYRETLDDQRSGILVNRSIAGRINQDVNRFNMNRWEVTPGIFAEYSYKYKEMLSVLVGLRADYSTMWHRVFVTPRFNVRYAPWKWMAIRGSVGLGYRSPNILTDYAAILSSSRTIYILEKQYQEQALNAGVSLSFFIPIAGRELQITGDYYYTDFLSSTTVDLDTDPHKVLISRQRGPAYSHNVQVEASMEILRNWHMTLAYRWSDVRQTLNGITREKPLTNRFKALITTSYTTPLKHWQFDFTAQFNGGGRMPDPDANHPLWDREYKWYPQLMAQVTRYFKHNWSVYVGAENMTNFRQKNPIISAGDPYSRDFDASMPWGPIDGWKVYAGFRWALTR